MPPKNAIQNFAILIWHPAHLYSNNFQSRCVVKSRDEGSCLRKYAYVHTSPTLYKRVTVGFLVRTLDVSMWSVKWLHLSGRSYNKHYCLWSCYIFIHENVNEIQLLTAEVAWWLSISFCVSHIWIFKSDRLTKCKNKPVISWKDRILEVTLISRVKYIFIITRECDLHFFTWCICCLIFVSGPLYWREYSELSHIGPSAGQDSRMWLRTIIFILY